MISLASLNPYGAAIKIGLRIAAVAAVFGIGLWIRGVFAERAALAKSEALTKESLKIYAQQLQGMVDLQRETADAATAIKQQSALVIRIIETAPAPGTDGAVVVLVPGGVLDNPLPGLPVLGTYSAGRAAPGAP